MGITEEINKWLCEETAEIRVLDFALGGSNVRGPGEPKQIWTMNQDISEVTTTLYDVETVALEKPCYHTNRSRLRPNLQYQNLSLYVAPMEAQNVIFGRD